MFRRVQREDWVGDWEDRRRGGLAGFDTVGGREVVQETTG